MSGDNWGVSSGRNDPLRASLVERARKRKVRAKKDPGWWAVEGSRALGDSYESYDVHLRDDDELWCACQNTKGGEYRTTCSHRTAVILFRKENPDPWEQESAQFPQLPPPPAPEFLDIRPVDPIPESESEDVIASFVPVSGDDTAGEELLAATSPANLFDRQRLEYDPIPAPEQLADPLKDIPFDPARFVDPAARAALLERLRRDGAVSDYLLRLRRADRGAEGDRGGWWNSSGFRRRI